MDKMYTTKEVAERYRVPLVTVQKWIREEKLPAIRPGKEYRIRESDLQKFEDECMTVKQKKHP